MEYFSFLIDSARATCLIASALSRCDNRLQSRESFSYQVWLIASTQSGWKSHRLHAHDSAGAKQSHWWEWKGTKTCHALSVTAIYHRVNLSRKRRAHADGSSVPHDSLRFCSSSTFSFLQNCWKISIRFCSGRMNHVLDFGKQWDQLTRFWWGFSF